MRSHAEMFYKSNIREVMLNAKIILIIRLIISIYQMVYSLWHEGIIIYHFWLYVERSFFIMTISFQPSNIMALLLTLDNNFEKLHARSAQVHF